MTDVTRNAIGQAIAVVVVLTAIGWLIGHAFAGLLIGAILALLLIVL